MPTERTDTAWFSCL